MSKQQIVIVGMARTPMGGLQGALASQSAPQLGAVAIRGALERSSVPASAIDQTIMGCVLQAGQGQAPARQAAIFAGVPNSVPATTVNKMCGSGMQAVAIAHDMIAAGNAGLVLAGGLESMSNAPYLLDRARTGYRMGHGTLADHMFLDGLEDAYDRGKLMGVFAENTAQQYQFTREQQDAFALRSLARAQAASADGSAASEIVPVAMKDRKGETIIALDEQPQNAKPDKIPTLKPAFRPDGTVTAANASSISDGAAALLVTTAEQAKQHGWPILATIVAHASHAHEPAWFTTAPVGAMKKCAARAGWQFADIDLFEVNEAFAVVTMAAQRELGLPDDKVNVRGGACALGHPIGASGARVLVTLLSAMQQRKLRRGMASLCIGGGEGIAMAVERPA